ncbi:MAG TPA: family 16 glycosylhydrolase [Myxococcota bacterium]|nr:family 16 glycosylhydrolase [Myxococcota bacterium]
MLSFNPLRRSNPAADDSNAALPDLEAAAHARACDNVELRVPYIPPEPTFAAPVPEHPNWFQRATRRQKIVVSSVLALLVFGVVPALIGVPVGLASERRKARERCRKFPTSCLPEVPPPPSVVTSFNESLTVGAFSKNVWNVTDGRANGIAACNFTRDAVTLGEGAATLSVFPQDLPPNDHACAQIDSLGNFTYGIFTTSLQAARHPGVVTQAATYVEPVPRLNSEIDIQINGNDSTTLLARVWRDGTASTVYVPLTFDASKALHTYAFDWKRDGVTWYVDDKEVAAYNDTPPFNDSRAMPREWPAAFFVNTWLAKPGTLAGDYDPDAEIEAKAKVAWVSYEPLRDARES